MGDSKAMAACINRVLEEPVLASRLREEARRKGAELDGRKAVRAMEDLYERILAS